MLNGQLPINYLFMEHNQYYLSVKLDDNQIYLEMSPWKLTDRLNWVWFNLTISISSMLRIITRDKSLKKALSMLYNYRYNLKIYIKQLMTSQYNYIDTD